MNPFQKDIKTIPIQDVIELGVEISRQFNLRSGPYIAGGTIEDVLYERIDEFTLEDLKILAYAIRSLRCFHLYNKLIKKLVTLNTPGREVYISPYHLDMENLLNEVIAFLDKKSAITGHCDLLDTGLRFLIDKLPTKNLHVLANKLVKTNTTARSLLLGSDRIEPHHQIGALKMVASMPADINIALRVDFEVMKNLAPVQRYKAIKEFLSRRDYCKDNILLSKEDINTLLFTIINHKQYKRDIEKMVNKSLNPNRRPMYGR